MLSFNKYMSVIKINPAANIVFFSENLQQNYICSTNRVIKSKKNTWQKY